MKKIIIVEDKPWVTQNAVCELQNSNVEVMRVVYYPNAFGDNEEKKKLLSDFKEKTHVEIDTVENQEAFIEKMEELYSQEDVVFFMDYDLKGDSTMEPENRINIRYTKHKEYMEGMNVKVRKIWFYTVSGSGNVDIIMRNFPKNILYVKKYMQGQLTWDMDQVKKILE